MIVEASSGANGRRLGPLIAGSHRHRARGSGSGSSYPLHDLPFGHVDHHRASTTGSGITQLDSSFIPSWVYWNYSGYQSPGKVPREGVLRAGRRP